ncbi:MAG: hypothetical protein ABFC34_16970 [Methanobacterium sp.]
MNLSEAKANIDTVDTQFSKVRHVLDDIMGALASAGELDPEVQEEYNQIEDEIFHVTKFVEKMGFEIRGRKRSVESNMFNLLGE